MRVRHPEQRQPLSKLRQRQASNTSVKLLISG